MYFSLFIFAFVYELIVVYDALRLNSMIQIVGLCIYNILLLAYAAYQPSNVQKALSVLSTSMAASPDGLRSLLPPDLHTWDRIVPALLGLILLQVVATAVLCFLAYKLHFEFAWVVYKVIHADLSMKKRLLRFQVSRRAFCPPVAGRSALTSDSRSIWPWSSLTFSSCLASSFRRLPCSPTSRMIPSLAFPSAA